ncbi:MATE family efflux transporter [Breznakiella homolactica]|uniref:Multidrug export protein MepA n=1 Tax=Breznakiella homolactica TaxID=2798577 RepID=A0A7T7XPD3_9SPIR|nr:MATE family efflux transporter [Breznakiella homolactica]QQO10051.1 MATE family efflux transporter [Breznakiella homolactica]
MANTKLAKQSIGAVYFRYALPAITGMVVSSLYTVVDGIFVGRGVGGTGLAAVNIVYPFIMFQIALTMLAGIGGANLFSLYSGRNERESANNVFCQGIAVLAGLSVIVNLGSILFAPQLCSLMGADAELLPLSVEYLRWIALFGIIYMPGLGISIFVRNDGNPGLEMAGTLAGALVNIVLDYLFIMRFGWGIAGAAVATGIGQMISVGVFATHFLSSKSTLRLRRPVFKPRELLKIFYNGSSSFLMEFSQSAVALSFNIVMVARLGAPGVAAYSVVMYICSIFNMVLIGVVQGAQPILSFNHGRGSESNVRKIHQLGIKTGLVLTVVFYGLVFFFGHNLAGLFSRDNPELTGMASDMMRFYFLGFFPIAVSLMNILLFQTTEQEGPSIIISLLRCIGFIQISLAVLPRFMGITGIYLSFFSGELLNCLVSVFFFIAYLRKSPGVAAPQDREAGMPASLSAVPDES